MCARIKSTEKEVQEDAVISLKAADDSLSDNSIQQYGSIENNSKSDNTISSASLKLIWSRRKTRSHLIAYWLYSLVIINIDEAFPLYCISRNTGLGGLQENEIGKILSASGVIFAIGQYKTYKIICDEFGIYGSLDLGAALGILPVALFPLASLVYTNANKRWSMVYLALLSGVAKVFQSAFFSSITVATNRTVPAEMRSRMNALDTQDDSNDKSLPIGSLLAWFGIALASGLSMYAVLRSLEERN
eukprot:scaffold5525_cov153-Skeletonema_dohrnii-CCMP3373.AAC.6